MTGRVLFVDDERRVLDGFQRQFRNRFSIDTAAGGPEGLEMLATHGPYGVIVSDLRMPMMMGLAFLTKSKEISPDSLRIVLTAYADVNTTLEATNSANVFRFLTKPCSGETLGNAVEDALALYRSILDQRLLVEKILAATVGVISEILSVVSPAASRQNARIRQMTVHAAGKMYRNDPWRFEAAGALSQIGCVALPPHILAKTAAGEPLSVAEEAMFRTHPEIARRLLLRVPRLKQIAEMIGRQNENCADSAEPLGDDVTAGARILKAAVDLDALLTSGTTREEAIAALRARGGYHLSVVDALVDFEARVVVEDPTQQPVSGLAPGMIFDQDVTAANGLLLFPRGHKVTPAGIHRLRCFLLTLGVPEPIRVLRMI